VIDFLLSLPTWAGCVFMMGFTTVVGFVVYLVFYKLISKYQREDMQDPTSNLFRVVGMLVSLMLALAFSEVIVELRTIRFKVTLVLHRPRLSIWSRRCNLKHCRIVDMYCKPENIMSACRTKLTY
jgi:hypothetical protein